MANELQTIVGSDSIRQDLFQLLKDHDSNFDINNPYSKK